MSEWAINPNAKGDEYGIEVGSWGELHAWLDSCDPDGKGYRGSACPLVEAMFVSTCYRLYRNGELLDGVAAVYSDMNGISGKPFTVIGEISPSNADYDVCALPLWECLVDEVPYVLYPEEIFQKY